MPSKKIALLLIVLGGICLPAPLYLAWAAQTTAPPPQTSQIYSAEPLDPVNESDQKRIVDRHGTAVALSIHQISERYSASEYQAPNETNRTLETAMETGSATTSDTGVQADLQTINQNYTFIYDAYRDRDQYYRFRVGEDGSTVQAQPAAIAQVANVTVEREVVHYSDLSPGEQQTVDRILRNSSEDSSGYRPYVDDPFVDRLPALVAKDGTLYSLYVTGHVDDFGPGFSGFVTGLAVAGIGGILLLIGTIMYVIIWVRER